MTARPIVVVDVETTGLDLARDHIWEFAGIRIEPDRFDYGLNIRIEHDRSLAADLPEKFRRQHDEACADGELIPTAAARALIEDLFQPGPDGRPPTLVGACPWFDAGFLRKLVGRDLWHHRLRCVESMTAGFIGVDPGGLSDCLEELGLAPIDEAHRAAGDADAALRIWRYLELTGEGSGR